MNNELSALEEFDAQRKIQLPHLMYPSVDLVAKKNIACIVLAKKEDEILLISPSGFSEASVIAGLTTKNVEHLARFAPREYKEILFSAVIDELLIQDIQEITKAMDDDYGGNSMINQQRVRNVLQYIYDNQVAFHF